ncbi:cilia- and flagella-associated protein 300-like [Dysidea avara]|uniref:cilia- and flagella-associated protein 300-like n=1 Tax=Dysidea avara TaxID=196820 RepID=UPI00331D6A33
MTSAEDEQKFTFQPLQNTFLVLEKPGVRDLFTKWGLQWMQLKTFYYNQHMKPYQKDDFVKDFFKDPLVNSHVQVVSRAHQWCPLGLRDQITKTTAETVPATSLSMSFFDRLTSAGIVRQSGSIVKCYDEMYGDIMISDELRKMLLMDDSDNYDVFSEEDRSEFLFKIFKHVCLGGSVCQYEDDVPPYLDTTKMLYKDLVSVVKDTKTNELSVSTIVFKVQAWVGDHLVFPAASEHEQTFCYLTVDPVKRHVTLWHHVWDN